VADDQPGARNNPYQVTKLALDLCQIGEDVRMIELDVVQNCCSGPVVHELRALIEKSRVIFVPLDHKEARRSEARGDREIGGDAPDQKAGGPPRVLEDPSKHRGGGRLAVSAGNSEHPLIKEDI